MVDNEAREETLARLARTRAEIRRVLEPPPPRPGAPASAPGTQHGVGENFFPRSRTMRLLLSGRGLGTVGAMAGGLLMARPALALRLLRMVPLGTVARLLMVKAVAGLRTKHE